MKTFALLISFLILASLPALSQSAKTLSKVTDEFVSTLSADEKAKVQLVFEDSARTKWTNLPIGLAARSGLRFGDLSEESKIKFHKIQSTVMSSQGYLKTFAIMQVDDILHEILRSSFNREKSMQVAWISSESSTGTMATIMSPSLEIPESMLSGD